MPAISNIVVADSVPSNHTYYPRSASMATSIWVETAAPIYEGNGRITASMSPPTSARRTTRSKFVHLIPVYTEVDGIYRVTDTIIFNTEAVMPVGVTPLVAANAYAQHKNLQSSSIVQAYFSSGDPAY